MPKQRTNLGTDQTPMVSTGGGSMILTVAIWVLIALILAVSLLLFNSVYRKSNTVPRTALERDMLVFKARLDNNPNDIRAHIGLGNVYLEQGNYRAAIHEYNVGIRLDPTFAQSYFAKGVAYNKMKRPQDAIKSLEKAVKVNSKYEPPLFELGKIYYDQKKYDRAKEYFNKSIALFETSADSYYYLGLSEEKTGNTAAAKKAYEQALSYIPDYDNAKKGLARISK